MDADAVVPLAVADPLVVVFLAARESGAAEHAGYSGGESRRRGDGAGLNHLGSHFLSSIELVLSPRALNHLAVVQQLPVVLVAACVDLWEGKRFR
jgi:hypothetical protein